MNWLISFMTSAYLAISMKGKLTYQPGFDIFLNPLVYHHWPHLAFNLVQ